MFDFTGPVEPGGYPPWWEWIWTEIILDHIPELVVSFLALSAMLFFGTFICIMVRLWRKELPLPQSPKKREVPE